MALTISACVLHITIEAGFDDGKLVFRSGQEDESHWCLDEFKVVDRDSGAVMWHIELDDSKQQPQFCKDDFPLVYGVTPPRLKTTVSAKPLASSHTYDIDGWSGNHLGGAFEYEVKRIVKNVRENRRR